jgi:hypothetical protein
MGRRRTLRLLFSAGSAALITACGGGGSDSDTDTSTATPTPNTAAATLKMAIVLGDLIKPQTFFASDVMSILQ